MHIEGAGVAKGGADAAIVRFWWAVEMFSPPKIEVEPSWEDKVFRLSPGEVPRGIWPHTFFENVLGSQSGSVSKCSAVSTGTSSTARRSSATPLTN